MTYKGPNTSQANRLAAVSEAEDALRRRLNRYINRERLAVMDGQTPTRSAVDYIAKFDPKREY